MSNKGKKVTVYEAIKGNGIIKYKRYNPLKKKDFDEIYVDPEEKIEFFKKKKMIQTAKTGKAFGPPPKKGPNPQGLKTGGINTGCPHRENGVKSDIKGISSIQIKGKKFIGVK